MSRLESTSVPSTAKMNRQQFDTAGLLKGGQAGREAQTAMLTFQLFALYSANDEGVSHTVTLTTAKPWPRAYSKIKRAIRSTVGLLSSKYIGSPRALSAGT